PRSPPPGRRATLLVVDNVPANLSLARSTFEPFGYEVVTACTLQQALALAREAPPDLILSDVHMPGGNGFDLLHAVKADSRLNRIPFVFISSTVWAVQGCRAQALALGAADFITRPLEPQALLSRIEACLKTRRE
nr:response regulator [Pseudomonadota bacterium]